MAHAVVHFEIDAEDDGPLVKFYGDLFGWALTGSGGGYTAIDTRGGVGINGGIGRSDNGAWSAFCVEADDPPATLDRATALGATPIMAATDLDGGLTMAMFRDLDGLAVGLVRGLTAGSGPSTGSGEAVDWFEIMGSDAQRTQDFYTELFGWTIDRSFPGYGVVDTNSGGRGLQGGVGGGVDGQWVMVYAGVPDVDERLRRIEELGGTSVSAPAVLALKKAAREALYGSSDDVTMAVFHDPAGNIFGVYHKEK